MILSLKAGGTGLNLVGADTVSEGLIDEIGGISEALAKLHYLVEGI